MRQAGDALIEKLPLITCILVPENRPEFALQSIRYFQRQDYPERELVVVDDGAMDLAARLPEDPRVRYLRVPPGLAAEQKRDYGCQQSRGEVLAFWDHSDWQAAERLSFQVAPILRGDADASALSTPEFIHLATGAQWTCSADSLFRIFKQGVNPRTLMIRVEVWRRRTSGDGLAWADVDEVRFCRLPNENMYVAMLRPGDKPEGAGWKARHQPIPPPSDFEFLKRHWEVPATPGPVRVISATPARVDFPRPLPRPERKLPLVSCIMPTYNRRRFVPLAIDYFLRQTYPLRELIIIDDGADAVDDLAGGDERIRYLRLHERCTIGAKRNMACDMARGDVIVHWDDDEWHGPDRIRLLVETLLEEKAAVCGLNPVLFYDLRSKQAWQYYYPPDDRFWICGSSLCYFRSFWEENRFPDIDIGEDSQFIWKPSTWRMAAAPHTHSMVCMIHEANVSPKMPGGGYWQPYPAEEILAIIGADWQRYEPASAVPAETPDNVPPKLSILVCSTFASAAKLAPMLEVIGRTAPNAVEVLIEVSHAARTASSRKQALFERAAAEHSWLIEDADSVSTARLAAMLEELRDSGPGNGFSRDPRHSEWQGREGILRHDSRLAEAGRSRPVFSICHTTGRPGRWKDSYDAWWSNCADPRRVEYVLCLDRRWGFSEADLPPLHRGTKVVWNTRRKCSVDGWNITAAAATGSVLILNADDFVPPPRWDTELLKCIPDLGSEFVIEVSSSAAATERRLMILGILSRERYQRLGYALYPEYESMYSDDEFTLHARRDGVVIDARHLEFPHRHAYTGEAVWDEVYAHQNRAVAYRSGEALLARRAAAGFPAWEAAAKTKDVGFDFDVKDIPLNPGLDVLVDVGVNRGQFARPALEYFRPRKYLGIEMLDDHVRELQADPRFHDGLNRFVVHCAAGAASGDAPVLRTNFSPSSSLLPVNPEAATWYGFDMTQTRQATVAVETLDNLCDRFAIDRIDLLKIDVQGYEGRVLAGATRMLDRTDCVVIEVLHQQHYFGQTSGEEIEARLAAHGLRFWSWLREHAAGGMRLEGDAVYLRL